MVGIVVWSLFTGWPVWADVPWTAVTCGAGSSLALKANGDLYGTGLTTIGAIGSKQKSIRPLFRTTWKRVLQKVVDVHTSGTHSIAVQQARKGSQLWVTGSNLAGQLGRKINRRIDTAWKKTKPLSGVVAVAAGNAQSYALKSDGTLWVVGASEQGDHKKSGLGSSFNGPYSTQWKQTMHKVIGFKPTAYGALAWTDDGQVQRISYYMSDLIPSRWEPIGEGFLDADTGHVITASGDLFKQKTLAEIKLENSALLGSGMKAVKGGDESLFALDRTDQLWYWVERTFDEIGRPNTQAHFEPVLSNVSSFCVSGSIRGSSMLPGNGGYALAVKKDGTLWATGNNTQGQFGNKQIPSTLSGKEWVQVSP